MWVTKENQVITFLEGLLFFKNVGQFIPLLKEF